MAQMTFNSIAGGDGSINNDVSVGVSWLTARGESTGTEGNGGEIIAEAGTDFTDRFFIKRAFIPFDTSTLPDGAKIQSATIDLFITEIQNSDNDGDDFINIVGPPTQGSTSSLGIADYDQTSSLDSPTEFATRIDIGNLSIDQYETWTLNATGLAQVSKVGVSNFAVREGHDIVGNTPVLGTNSGTKIKFSTSDELIVLQRPLLTVVFKVSGKNINFFGGPFVTG